MAAHLIHLWCLIAMLSVLASCYNLDETHFHRLQQNEQRSHGSKGHDTVPDAWDWRSQGQVVSPVVDQSQSEISAFAIDVADSINSFYTIKTGNVTSLSIQEVDDCCSSNPISSNIYKCIVRIDGLCTTDDYQPTPDGECNWRNCWPVQPTIKWVYSVIPNNETDLKVSVYRNPAVVTIDASQPSFQTYQSGVYDDANCSTDNLNHALLVVGYGQVDGVDVWICKNTWGVNWGVKGYIYVTRGKNTCGIATLAMIPI